MGRAVKVGLVGTGGVAHNHLAGYSTVVGNRAVVWAACDPRSDVLEAFCNKYAIPHRFADAQSMVGSGEVDVAVVLTRPEIREAVILPALEHGVPILVEKPFGQSFSEAAKYVEAADQAGVPLAVSQNFRWFPEYQWMAGHLADGRLGDLRFIEHHVFQDRRQPPGAWRAEQKRLEMAIFSVHLIDRMQWLAVVVPLSVAAITRRDEASELPGEQFTTLIVQFEGGLVGQMTSSWMARGLATNAARVDAERGSVTVERSGPMAGNATGRLQVHEESVEIEAFVDNEVVRDGPRSYGYSLLSFLDAIEKGKEAPHSGRDNLRTMAIMDAAYVSASRGGAMVQVDEVTGGVRLTQGSRASS